MNFDELKTAQEDIREKYMREQLGQEKCKILDKFNLHPNSRLYWERREPKYPVQEYFSHKLALKSTPLGMIFHINHLCFAKVKYFENNWNEFCPCTHDFKKGFVETELYNMEFIKHRKTGIILDLRELSKIHWLKDFHALCAYLEEQSKLYLTKEYQTNIKASSAMQSLTTLEG